MLGSRTPGGGWEGLELTTQQRYRAAATLSSVAQAKIEAVASALGASAAEIHSSAEAAPFVGLILRMDQHGNDRDAPVRELMARLGDRWSTLILLILSTGTFRHATLRRLVTALSSERTISQRMLTLRLRALERNGMVRRAVSSTIPPQVDYSLSPLGMEFVQLLTNLLAWIERHDADIRSSRQKYEADGK